MQMLINHLFWNHIDSLIVTLLNVLAHAYSLDVISYCYGE